MGYKFLFSLMLIMPGMTGLEAVVYEPKDLSTSSYNCTIDGNAGMLITVSGQSFAIGSTFSVPGGGTQYLGYSSSPNWNPRITQPDNSSYAIDANNGYYSVHRQISLLSNRIAVQDTFCNLRTGVNDLLGIIFVNQVHISGDVGSTIAGNLSLPNTINTPERPFVHAVKNGASVGLIARDDIYRNQSICFGAQGGSENNYGIQDETFGLTPGACYTVKWEIYPVTSSDYYDFINTVRCAWNTTHTTLPGLYGFADPNCVFNGKAMKQWTVSDMRNWLNISQVKNVCFVIPAAGNIEAFGSDYFSSYSQSVLQAVMNIAGVIHAADPNVKVYPYFHMGCNRMDPPYNTQLQNCRVMLEDGTQKTFTSGGSQVRGYYYASPANAWDRLISSVYFDMASRFDGIYWDEFDFGNVSVYMKGVADWDGSSVRLDSNTNVLYKLTNQCLINRQVSSQFRQILAGCHKPLFANWEPVTEETTAAGIPCFLEYVQPADYPRGHLNCPMGYGHSIVTSNADIAKEAYNFLQFGIIYGVSINLYAPLSQPSMLGKFFPITPVEIHSGYIIGRERIITSLSGLFGFGDSRTLQCCVFDVNGNPKSYNGTSINQNGKTYQSLSLAPGEIAIITRTPCPGPYLPGDMSGPEGSSDCRVNFYDLAEFVSQWLECTDPANIMCNASQ